MKKILKFSEIDCANCAAKVEKNISKLEGVKSARVVFLTQKIILEVEEDCDKDGNGAEGHLIAAHLKSVGAEGEGAFLILFFVHK